MDRNHNPGLIPADQIKVENVEQDAEYGQAPAPPHNGIRAVPLDDVGQEPEPEAGPALIPEEIRLPDAHFIPMPAFPDLNNLHPDLYPIVEPPRVYPQDPIPRVLVAQLVNELWGLNIPLDAELLNAPREDNQVNPFTLLGTIIRNYLVFTHEQLLLIMPPHDAREEVTRIFTGEMERIVDQNIAAQNIRGAFGPHLGNGFLLNNNVQPAPAAQPVQQAPPAAQAPALPRQERQRLIDVHRLLLNAVNFAQEANFLHPDPHTRQIVEQLENHIRMLQQQMDE